jgi:hypothetical protein
VQDSGGDLALAVGARGDRPGGAERIAESGKTARAKVPWDVDHRDPRGGDALAAEEDEVGVAVAVGVDPLDVDDPPARRLATREVGRTARRFDPRRRRTVTFGGLVRVGRIRGGRLRAAAGGEQEAGGAGQPGQV